jgi:hypothetical protein
VCVRLRLHGEPDLRGSRAAALANLHAVAVELREMTKATKELNEIIRNASLEPA